MRPRLVKAVSTERAATTAPTAIATVPPRWLMSRPMVSGANEAAAPELKMTTLMIRPWRCSGVVAARWLKMAAFRAGARNRATLTGSTMMRRPLRTALTAMQTHKMAVVDVIRRRKGA